MTARAEINNAGSQECHGRACLACPGHLDSRGTVPHNRDRRVKPVKPAMTSLVRRLRQLLLDFDVFPQIVVPTSARRCCHVIRREARGRVRLDRVQVGRVGYKPCKRPSGVADHDALSSPTCSWRGSLKRRRHRWCRPCDEHRARLANASCDDEIAVLVEHLIGCSCGRRRRRAAASRR